MTGKSKWSDELQKRTVDHILISKPWLSMYTDNNIDFPSEKTVERWVVKWTPIILKEVKEENNNKQRQDRTRKDRIRQDKPRVRQDDSKFKGAHAAWLALYPSMIKRFIRFGYGNFVDFTEVVNDYFNNTKKEVDKRE